MTFPAYRPRRARVIGLIGGTAAFFWLRLEDQNTLIAALCGIALAVLALGIYAWRQIGGRAFSARTALFGAALFGGLCGLGGAVAAAVLMLLKNGFHAHLFPDYPFGMIGETLLRAPLWAFAGALIACGLMAAALAAQSQVEIDV